MNKLTLSLERSSMLDDQIPGLWPPVPGRPSLLAQRPDADEDALEDDKGLEDNDDWDEDDDDDWDEDDDDWDEDDDDWDEDDDDWDEDDDDWDEDDDDWDDEEGDEEEGDEKEEEEDALQSRSTPHHRPRPALLDDPDIIPVEARFLPKMVVPDPTSHTPRRFPKKSTEELSKKKKEPIRRPNRLKRPLDDRLSGNDDPDWED